MVILRKTNYEGRNGGFLQSFKTKDMFMKHKKKDHSTTVQTCEKYQKNNCDRTDKSCWFKHCLEERNKNQDISGCEGKQVFQEAQSQLIPPDQISQMMDLLKNMWSKMEMIQKPTA